MGGLTAPAPRGACPDLLSPMASGDGLLLRVKPPVGGLSATQIAAIARGAREGGNGVVEITGRGNLQLRGFTEVSAAAFAEAMLKLDLAVPEASAERVRNILVAPLAGDDPSAAPEAEAIARAIEAGLRGRRTLWSLPAKFGFAVDAGGRLPLGDVMADIRLMPAVGGWLVGGSGLSRAVHVAARDAAATALRLAEACVRLWETRADHESRLRHLAARDEAGFWRAAGIGPTVAAVTPGAATACRFGRTSYGNGLGTYALAAPFGATSADALEAMAAMMLDLGIPSLTIGPWRSLHLRGMPEHALSAVAMVAKPLGLIGDPEDPRLRVAACAGAPACSAGSVPARRDAGAIAASLGPGAARIHVAGCAKGCASARPADLTLVGHEGRYALIRAGRAGDPPAETGLDLDAAIRRVAALTGPRA